MHVLQRQTGCDRGAQRPLAMDVVGFESGAVGFDQEAANAIVLVFDFGPDDRDIGDGAGGDPHFFAINHVFGADFFGPGAHAAGVRAEVGFGQAEAAELFSLLHRRQPGLLLFVAPELVNWIHAESGLHAHETADARVAALKFLRHQAVFHVAHAGASVAFQGRAEKAQIGHGLDQFTRKAAGAGAFLDNGDQVVFDELPRGIANEALFVGQQGIVLDEIDAAEFDGRHDDLLMNWGLEIKAKAVCRLSDRAHIGGQTYDGSRGEGAWSTTVRRDCRRAPGRASFRLFWYRYLEVSLVLRFAMVKGNP